MSYQEKIIQQLLQQTNQVINHLNQITMILYRILNSYDGQIIENNAQQVQNTDQDITGGNQDHIRESSLQNYQYSHQPYLEQDMRQFNVQNQNQIFVNEIQPAYDQLMIQTHTTSQNIQETQLSGQQNNDFATQLRNLHEIIAQANNSFSTSFKTSVNQLQDNLQQLAITSSKEFQFQYQQHLYFEYILILQIINQYYSLPQQQSFAEIYKNFPDIPFQQIKQLITLLRIQESDNHLAALHKYETHFLLKDVQEYRSYINQTIIDIYQQVSEQFFDHQIVDINTLDIFSHLHSTFIQYNEEMNDGEEELEEFEEKDETSAPLDNKEDVQTLNKSISNQSHSKSFKYGQIYMDFVPNLIQQHQSHANDKIWGIIQKTGMKSTQQVKQQNNAKTYHYIYYNFEKDFLNIIQKGQQLGILESKVTLEYMNSQLLHILLNRILQFNEEYILYVIGFLNLLKNKDYKQQNIIYSCIHQMLIMDMFVSRIDDQLLQEYKKQFQKENFTDITISFSDNQELKHAILNQVLKKYIQPVIIAKNILNNSKTILLSEIIEICIDIVYICVKFGIVDNNQ